MSSSHSIPPSHPIRHSGRTRDRRTPTDTRRSIGPDATARTTSASLRSIPPATGSTSATRPGGLGASFSGGTRGSGVARRVSSASGRALGGVGASGVRSREGSSGTAPGGVGASGVLSRGGSSGAPGGVGTSGSHAAGAHGAASGRRARGGGHPPTGLTASGVSASSGEPEARIHLEEIPSTITMGTLAGGTMVEVEKMRAKEHRRKDAAFLQMKGMVREIRPNMQYLSINLDTLAFTIYNEDGGSETLGFDQIRGEIARVRGVRTRGGASAAKVLVDGECDRLATELRQVASVSGLTNIWPYSSRGQEARGNIIGGKAMAVTNEYIQMKQARDLMRGVDNRHCLPAIIKRLPVVPVKAQDEFAKAVLKREAFVIKFREKLEQRIKTLELTPPTADPAAEMQRQKQIRDLKKLKQDIEKNMNRHALYYTTAYPDPKICYEKLRRDLYESAIEGMKEPKPGFEDFMASPDGRACHEYAADVASTLITDASLYKQFCMEMNIQPKEDHINGFLIQAMAHTPGSPPAPIQYNAVSISFDTATRTILDGLIAAAHAEVDTITVPAYPRGLARLDAAVAKDSPERAHYRDPLVPEPHRGKRWWRRRNRT